MMATVKEVITSQLGYKIPEVTINTIIAEHGLNGGDERNPNDNEQSRAIDLSKADAIDFLIMRPKTVKELDYQMTQQDASALLDMRRRLLAKWGIVEPDGQSGFVDLSNTH